MHSQTEEYDMSNLTDREEVFLTLLHKLNIENKEEMKDFASCIDVMANNFSFHRDELAKAILNDTVSAARFDVLTAVWIDYWSKQPEYAFDGRNESARRACMRLATNAEFQDLAAQFRETSEWKAFTALIELPFSKYGTSLRTMHKTLMQTFTGLILSYIEHSPRIEYVLLSAGEQERNGDRWYRLPLV